MDLKIKNLKIEFTLYHPSLSNITNEPHFSHKNDPAYPMNTWLNSLKFEIWSDSELLESRSPKIFDHDDYIEFDVPGAKFLTIVCLSGKLSYPIDSSGDYNYYVDISFGNPLVKIAKYRGQVPNKLVDIITRDKFPEHCY